MMWQTTWQSRWTTPTPSRCQSRASHQQNVGRTCTSCSTSTPSSQIPPASWRKTPQRTAFQVGTTFQHFFTFLLSSHLYACFQLHFPLVLSYFLSHIICTKSCFFSHSYFLSCILTAHRPCSYILLPIVLHSFMSFFFNYVNTAHMY